MTDREKVIEGLKICMDPTGSCYDCPYSTNAADPELCGRQAVLDVLRLLKEQDARYKEMVVEWLREMAHNNYQEVNFLDAILDIRERAMIGLENYFKDYKKG